MLRSESHRNKAFAESFVKTVKPALTSKISVTRHHLILLEGRKEKTHHQVNAYEARQRSEYCTQICVFSGKNELILRITYTVSVSISLKEIGIYRYLGSLERPQQGIEFVIDVWGLMYLMYY